MNQHCNDEFWMRYALVLADNAQDADEIPVGAVLVLNNEIIGKGWNCSISQHDPTAHAEIIALRHGGQKIGNYRLLNAVMYVTLKPCLMCAGAMMHARIGRLVFGASNEKISETGTNESGLLLLDTFTYPDINHRIMLTGGVLRHTCSVNLRAFFKKLRMEYKARRFNR